MALKDSTSILHSSIEQKAKLGKNYDTKNNYWLQSVQDKINAEWTYRSNVVDIEEELVRQTTYTKEDIKFSPLEVVIQEVITDKGEKLSKDWRRIVTRDCDYYNYIGKRFRFTRDLVRFQTMTEEEKKWNSSVWIGVNLNNPSPTEGLVIRRCNATIGFAGTLTGRLGDGVENKIVEYHYEPVIIETSVKGINTYYNQQLNIAQGEFYAICQYNYFTQFLHVEDRVLLGDINPIEREKNEAYRVKFVKKFDAEHTYDFDNPDLTLSDVPLVLIGLEKTQIEDGDNLEKGTPGFRVAERAPVYKVEGSPLPPEEDYGVVIEEPYDTQIDADEYSTYTAYVYKGDRKLQGEGYTIEVEGSLDGTTKPRNYYNITSIDENTFKVSCIFGYVKSNLVLKFKWKERPDVLKEIEVELRSW